MLNLLLDKDLPVALLTWALTIVWLVGAGILITFIIGGAINVIRGFFLELRQKKDK